MIIPGVINDPESMLKFRVITVKEYLERALKTLQRVGVLHVDEARELKPADKAAIELERGEVSDLLAFVENILSYLPQKEEIPLEDDVEVIYTRPFSEISSEVRALYNRVTRLYQSIVKLNDEVKHLTTLKRQLEPLAEKTAFKLKDLNFTGEYIFSRVFVLSTESLEALRNRLKDYILGGIIGDIENQTVFCVIARVKDQRTIESIVASVGAGALQIPDEDLTLREFIETATKKIKSLEEESAKLQRELQDKVKQDLKRIVLLREALSAQSERLAVLEKAAEAKYVILVEGWIPEKNIEDATAEIKEDLKYVFVDSRKPLPGETPPSKLKNAKLLKPFELIVKVMDIPKYGGWDPTPIVAYSFALFYGIMLGDVIYGLALMVATRFLLPKFTDNPQSDNFKLFQRVIYSCSTVAVIMGLLTGCYMGDIHKVVFGLGDIALAPLVAEMLGNPMSFIVVAICIGLVHIDLAHLLALIKGVQDKNKGVVLNRVGLFLIQFGIPGAIHSLLKVDVPLSDQVLSTLNYFMYVGVILIIISNLMMNKVVGGFLWIFDITGIFGDVVSYARLAGVGLAGFYLGHALNLMVVIFGKIFPGPVGFVVGTAAGLAIFTFGHTINVVTSGIGCFVPSLRLCFVEFLLKFFDGGGREYSPFRLKRRASVVVSVSK